MSPCPAQASSTTALRLHPHLCPSPLLQASGLWATSFHLSGSEYLAGDGQDHLSPFHSDLSVVSPGGSRENRTSHPYPRPTASELALQHDPQGPVGPLKPEKHPEWFSTLAACQPRLGAVESESPGWHVAVGHFHKAPRGKNSDLTEALPPRRGRPGSDPAWAEQTTEPGFLPPGTTGQCDSVESSAPALGHMGTVMDEIPSRPSSAPGPGRETLCKEPATRPWE